MSDPSADITNSWDSAKAWIGTYVIGTIKCVRLLATHGLLNHQATLVLAKGLDSTPWPNQRHTQIENLKRRAMQSRTRTLWRNVPRFRPRSRCLPLWMNRNVSISFRAL